MLQADTKGLVFSTPIDYNHGKSNKLIIRGFLYTLACCKLAIMNKVLGELAIL